MYRTRCIHLFHVWRRLVHAQHKISAWESSVGSLLRVRWLVGLSPSLSLSLSHLRRTADLPRPERARRLPVRRPRPLRPAALLRAVLLPSAVALLALLHHAVAAQRALGLCGLWREEN